MPDLCVNIDHVATVREARKTWEPDPQLAAREAQRGGAAGVTFHLREDRRHIQDADLPRLREAVKVRLNMEMAATDEMVGIAIALRPDMAMLVPEGRLEITTEGGLDVAGAVPHLTAMVGRLEAEGIPVSAFIDADPEQIRQAAVCGFRFCELHTGPYADCVHRHRGDLDHPEVAAARSLIQSCIHQVRELGMSCNAGHALNYDNVPGIATLEGLSELHIGHSIVSRAVFVGLRRATEDMLGCMTGQPCPEIE